MVKNVNGIKKKKNTSLKILEADNILHELLIQLKERIFEISILSISF